MKRALLIGGNVVVVLLVAVCAGTPFLTSYLRGRVIHVDLYVDNATAQEVAIEFDGEDWGSIPADSYRKYDGKPIKPGSHTIIVRRVNDRMELERRTEVMEDFGPWVLNIQSAQTYLQVSDHDLQAKEKFDIRDGHQKAWFRIEYNGFTRVAPNPAFGMFHYHPNATHVIRWSQIPDSRKAKVEAKGPP
jgi:hypothetical protein